MTGACTEFPVEVLGVYHLIGKAYVESSVLQFAVVAPVLVDTAGP